MKETILWVEGITAFYGSSQALFGVNLEVHRGEVVALLGRNGMGKSTTIKSICRILPHREGRIAVDGNDLAAIPSHKAARLGIGLVPEGRRCFAPLTVEENLLASSRSGHWSTQRVYGLFPQLRERCRQPARTLSGGEQQMLAIGRALCTNPRILLLDEATEGLAPIVCQQIWAAILELKSQTGLAILLVDKSLAEISRVADKCVILERGEDVWTGCPGQLDDETRERFLSL